MDSLNSDYIFKIIVDNHSVVIRTDKQLEIMFHTLSGGVFGDNYIKEMIKTCLLHPELEKFKFKLCTAEMVNDFEYALMGVINDYLSAKPVVESLIYQSIQVIRNGGYNEIRN